MVCCVILTTLDVSLFYLKVQEKAFFVIVYEKKNENAEVVTSI